MFSILILQTQRERERDLTQTLSVSSAFVVGGFGFEPKGRNKQNKETEYVRMYVCMYVCIIMYVS